MTMLLKLQGFIAILLSGSVSLATAATPAIGLVRVNGSYRMDGVSAWGNGTLFDGTVIETEKLPSELNFQNGARVLLSPGSRSKIYRDRMVLEMGAAELRGADYRLEARTLAVIPANPEVTARIALNRTDHVEVAALNGSVMVRNSSGTLIANVRSGAGLDLDTQAAGAAGAIKLSGCLEYQKDTSKYVLMDETTNVTVELKGAGLDKLVGRRVEITGAVIPGATPVVAGATKVIQVTAVKELDKGTEKCAGNQGIPSASAGGGGVSKTTIAIIGGITAAAAGLGLGIHEATKSP